MDQRSEIQDAEISAIFKMVADALQQRIKAKGKGALMSHDEISGRLEEALRIAKSALYAQESQMLSLLNLSVESLWSLMSQMAIERGNLEKSVDVA